MTDTLDLALAASGCDSATVLHSAHGAPGIIVLLAAAPGPAGGTSGRLPIATGASAGAGTLIWMIRRRVPAVSNT